MVTGIIIGIALFAALLALLVASYGEGRREAAEGSAPDHVHTPGPDGGECVLCHGPLPHLGTSDQAVMEIERRIASDLEEVGLGVTDGDARRPAPMNR